MDRLWRRALVSAMSVFVVGAFLPGASQADSSGCPGLYCLWTKENFEGKRFAVDTRQLTNFPDFINNTASSVKWDIPEGKVLRLYQGKNGEGKFATLCDRGKSPEIPASNRFSSGEIRSGVCV